MKFIDVLNEGKNAFTKEQLKKSKELKELKPTNIAYSDKENSWEIKVSVVRPYDYVTIIPKGNKYELVYSKIPNNVDDSDYRKFKTIKTIKNLDQKDVLKTIEKYAKHTVKF